MATIYHQVRINAPVSRVYGFSPGRLGYDEQSNFTDPTILPGGRYCKPEAGGRVPESHLIPFLNCSPRWVVTF